MVRAVRPALIPSMKIGPEANRYAGRVHLGRARCRSHGRSGHGRQPGRQVAQGTDHTQAVEEHVLAKVRPPQSDVHAAAAAGCGQIVGFDDRYQLVVDRVIQVDRCGREPAAERQQVVRDERARGGEGVADGR